MSDIRITLVQTELYWENPVANRAMLEEQLSEITTTDLIVLPEMFTTGFTMEASKVAELMNQDTFKWLKQMSQRFNACILGSYVVKEKNQFYNRLIAFHPDGKYEVYDKRHLFRMGEEHLTYTAGNDTLILEVKGWKIAPFICYDLRFPVWSRNKNQAYDAAIYIANWPAPRALAWKTLLQARAIENLAYVIGVNRIGTDGKNLPYAGDSRVVQFDGEILLDLGSKGAVETITLSKNKLEEYRKKFPAYLDADTFTIQS
ncbi:MAG: amidohydrolase [Cytophagaceae bacterium]